jgi:hypothetical protein
MSLVDGTELQDGGVTLMGNTTGADTASATTAINSMMSTDPLKAKLYNEQLDNLVKTKFNLSPMAAAPKGNSTTTSRSSWRKSMSKKSKHASMQLPKVSKSQFLNTKATGPTLIVPAALEAQARALLGERYEIEEYDLPIADNPLDEAINEQIRKLNPPRISIRKKMLIETNHYLASGTDWYIKIPQHDL